MKNKSGSFTACIVLASLLVIASNRAWAAEQCSAGGSNVVAAGGGCLLGASVGTFIFPGVGTAVGCAAVGLGSWAWKLFSSPETDSKQACVDSVGKTKPDISAGLRYNALAKLPE